MPAAVKIRIEEWIVAADIYEGRISPDAEPLTYSEARQLLAMPVAASQRKKPGTSRPWDAATLANDAISDTAEDAGMLDNYQNAVDKYRKAMKLNDAWKAVRAICKVMLTRTIQNVPWIGATYAIARKYMP